MGEGEGLQEQRSMKKKKVDPDGSQRPLESLTFIKKSCSGERNAVKAARGKRRKVVAVLMGKLRKWLPILRY